MKKFLFVSILILLSVVSAFCGEFEDALKKAEHGDANAQYNLGFMYLIGLGVPQDHEQALDWSTKAAEQGIADAQYLLGLMYTPGHGVPQNDKQAIYWYTKAAEQGHTDAQKNLGFMYAQGHGVPQNRILSYVWLSLAAAQGDEFAIRNRDIIAKRLTRQQLAEAQELAAQIQNMIDNPSKSQ